MKDSIHIDTKKFGEWFFKDTNGYTFLTILIYLLGGLVGIIAIPEASPWKLVVTLLIMVWVIPSMIIASTLYFYFKGNYNENKN